MLIFCANGNVNISAVGNANILVVTGTGANITGTANVTGYWLQVIAPTNYTGTSIKDYLLHTLIFRTVHIQLLVDDCSKLKC